VNLRCQRQFAAQDYKVNTVALKSYLDQLGEVWHDLGSLKTEAVLSAVVSQALALPGVVPEPGGLAFDATEEWPLLERVLNEALARLQAMRQEEGRAMAQEFLQLRATIAEQLNVIRARIPQVAQTYRDRLHERVQAILDEHDVHIDRTDLIKEVAVFAERSDISEEVVRLASHLDQFLEIMNEPESPGRKLEFLAQEMFREANTMGSKSGDVEISRRVVEIKGTLEKIRELVQNVE
jgi:uncharacterized protein (TIGR00255 family)